MLIRLVNLLCQYSNIKKLQIIMQRDLALLGHWVCLQCSGSINNNNNFNNNKNDNFNNNNYDDNENKNNNNFMMVIKLKIIKLIFKFVFLNHVLI